MATWVISTTVQAIVPASTTIYQAPMGSLNLVHTTEPRAEVRARTAYLQEDLWTRIQVNATTGSSTVRSRVNGANGNQLVTIGAGLTGIFEDTVNSDTISVGATFNSQIVSGAGGTVQFNPGISYTLTDVAGGNRSIISANGDDIGLVSATRYIAVSGDNSSQLTEIRGQYTLRVAATFSNVRIFITANSLTGSSTLGFRANGADGNQTTTIGAGLTGAFEDTVNSDVMASGDTIGIQIIVGAGGTLDHSLSQLQMESTGRTTTLGRANPLTFPFQTVTTFASPEGAMLGVGSADKEARTEIISRSALDAQNYFVRATTNDLDASTLFDMHLNRVVTGLGVSVGAGLTGTFEDTVSSVSVLIDDSYGNIFDLTASTEGAVNLNYVGFQADQPPSDEDLPPGTLLLPA